MKMTFSRLFDKIKEIEIPMLQRDYAQGRENEKTNNIRKNFVKSLCNAIKNEKNLNLDFIYGTIENEKFIPLDGQQRLTTLFLLYCYIFYKTKNTENFKYKFTYQTRVSTREFCEKLIEFSIIDNKYNKEYENIKATIENQSWFFNSWLNDPSISGMLIMLNEIENEFKNFDLNNIKIDSINITFQYLNLENFGLSDELYLKMNSRGKFLNDFENFKAKFIEILEQNNFDNISKNLTKSG